MTNYSVLCTISCCRFIRILYLSVRYISLTVCYVQYHVVDSYVYFILVYVIYHWRRTMYNIMLSLHMYIFFLCTLYIIDGALCTILCCRFICIFYLSLSYISLTVYYVQYHVVASYVYFILVYVKSLTVCYVQYHVVSAYV